MATTKTPQLTTSQVCKMFGVSNMTLLNWRKGTKNMAPLPVAAKKASDTTKAIHYNVAGVVAWAKKHGIVLEQTAEQVVGATTDEQSKPGPKKRAKLV